MGLALLGISVILSGTCVGRTLTLKAHYLHTAFSGMRSFMSELLSGRLIGRPS
jgi:hypothetical protein